MSESGPGARPVVQKLLTHGLGTWIVDDGYEQVGGVVVLAAALDTPDRLLSAYGFEGGQEFVDGVRFELPRLPTLTNPVAPDARRWVGVP